MNQTVPWALKRKALVYFEQTQDWQPAEGVPHYFDNPKNPDESDYVPGGEGWECTEYSYNAEKRGPEHVLRLPGQCVRCYSVDDHEVGCMVAENLAKGVPEFWAPWAMETLPPNAPEFKYSKREWLLFELVDGQILPWMQMGSSWNDWRGNYPEDLKPGEGIVGSHWVVVGPDGPTLEPWATDTQSD